MALLETLLQNDGRLRISWLGNDGWLFAQGGHLIATDLDFCLPERTLPPFTEWEALARHLGVLFVTHAHTDHFNPETVQRLMAGGSCTLVLPESCRPAAESYGLNQGRVVYARPGCMPLDLTNNPLPIPRAGGRVEGLPGWLSAEAVRALHGHTMGAVYGGANAGDCGYLLRFGGSTIFEPGDSVLLQEHLELTGIDLLLVSPTEHNMNVEPARHWIETVRPRRVFAQHFGTYREEGGNAFWTHGYQCELGAALDVEMKQRYTIPACGQVITL